MNIGSRDNVDLLIQLKGMIEAMTVSGNSMLALAELTLSRWPVLFIAEVSIPFRNPAMKITACSPRDES